MPLEKRTTASQLRAVSIGIAALAVAVGVTIMFFQAAGNGKAPVVVSDTTDQFRVGNATAMAKSIAGDGPLLFSDVSGRGQQRPIYVTHQGADPPSGWRSPPKQRARPMVVSCSGMRRPIDSPKQTVTANHAMTARST